MSEPLWRLEGITRRGTPRPRLRDVTLTIAPGVTAVIGNSGAGKTSLLNLLVGFERPDQGVVAADLSAHARPLALFWVPQNGGLWPHLTVREHLAAVTSGRGPDLIRRGLAAFDLTDRADAYPDQLAQGERARLAVARALAADPAVLVMDEPLSHVDPARVERYWQVIRDHLDASGASLVFATHSPRRVLSEAQRVACLAEGRLVYDGDVETLYERPATPELAACLGEGNWMPEEAARLWLGDDAPGSRFLRPERLAVVPDPAGGLRVRSSRFQGAVSEVELEHLATGEIRTFYHRGRWNGLGTGATVVLKALLLLVAVTLLGCGDAGETPLVASEVREFVLPPEGARLPAPRSVTAGHDDEIVVLDSIGRVLVYDAARRLARRWWMPATEVGRPEGVCVLTDGRIAVADTHYHRVLVFDRNGAVLSTIGERGRGPGAFLFPVGVAEDDRGNLYVSEYGSNDRVQKFDRDGNVLLAFGSFGTGRDQFQRPSGLVWHAGKVFVADAANNRIQVFSDAGRFLGTLGGEDRSWSLRFPYDIAVDGGGVLHVVEYGAGRVTRLSPEGRLLGRFGRVGVKTGCFRTPWGIAVDSRRRVLVADTGNRRVVEVRLQP